MIGSASFILGFVRQPRPIRQSGSRCCTPGHSPGGPCHSASSRALFRTRSQAVWTHTKFFLVAGDATVDVNRRGNCVFDISQKLLLDVKMPVPVLRIFDRVWACAPKIAQTYVRIESLRRSTPACLKPSDLSRTNVVQAPEMSRLLPDNVCWIKERTLRCMRMPI